LTGPFDPEAKPLGSLALRCDNSGSVSAVSGNCEALLGVPASALLGRGFFERVQVADRPAFLQAISDAGRAIDEMKTTLRWRAGLSGTEGACPEPVFRWLEMRVCRDPEFCLVATGQTSVEKQLEGAQGIIFLFHDVTQARLDETQCTGLDGRSTSVGDLDGWLAQVAHELCTPLNAIVGFSELLGSPRLAPLDLEKQREYARIINQSGLHLLSVIDAVLNLSRMKLGSLPVAPSPFSVTPLVDLCCDMVKLHARKNDVELLRAYPKSLGPITTDKRAFIQILINILSNAIKFTPAKGSVTISAKIEAQSLLICIADTGIGIAIDDLAQLGAPFFQAKASIERSGKGSGLGLSIVCSLVGRLGGSIRLASEQGKGTCVTVSFPLDGRELTNDARTPAKIETLAVLAPLDQPEAYPKMMVKKIA